MFRHTYRAYACCCVTFICMSRARRHVVVTGRPRFTFFPRATPGCSPHMASISDLDARILALEQEIFHLKNVRNGLSPLHRLPDELLLHIAHFVVFEREDVSRTSLLAISSVTRQLRSLFVNSYQLWSYIDLNWSDTSLFQFLERAHNHPLHCIVATRRLGAKSKNALKEHVQD
jgi:hypothetical protein